MEQAPQQAPQLKVYTLTLTTEQISAVLNGLNELPRKVGDQAFVSVSNQVYQAQLKAQAEAKASTPDEKGKEKEKK